MGRTFCEKLEESFERTVYSWRGADGTTSTGHADIVKEGLSRARSRCLSLFPARQPSKGHTFSLPNRQLRSPALSNVDAVVHGIFRRFGYCAPLAFSAYPSPSRYPFAITLYQPPFGFSLRIRSNIPSFSVNLSIYLSIHLSFSLSSTFALPLEPYALFISPPTLPLSVSYNVRVIISHPPLLLSIFPSISLPRASFRAVSLVISISFAMLRDSRLAKHTGCRETSSPFYSQAIFKRNEIRVRKDIERRSSSCSATAPPRIPSSHHDVSRTRRRTRTTTVRPVSHGRKAFKIFDRAKMTDVGDESPPQRRVVGASNDPRKDRTVHTSRSSTNRRYTTSTKDKRYCFLRDTLYKSCASPVKTLQRACSPVRLFQPSSLLYRI